MNIHIEQPTNSPWRRHAHLLRRGRLDPAPRSRPLDQDSAPPSSAGAKPNDGADIGPPHEIVMLNERLTSGLMVSTPDS